MPKAKMMDTTIDEGRLLSVAQACERLRCGKKKLYELSRTGKIEMVKLGHSTRVTEASLRRLVNELPRK
jgi:excisionase family DNA binding protein